MLLLSPRTQFTLNVQTRSASVFPRTVQAVNVEGEVLFQDDGVSAML
jgi:hypothetical protein